MSDEIENTHYKEFKQYNQFVRVYTNQILI